MSDDAYRAGYSAREAGRPHNPHSSADWKRGYAWANEMLKDDNRDRDEGCWFHDADMESR